MTGHTKPILYTIGHSTRTIEQFVALLQAHNIKKVVDVRTIPKSRHNPQFGQDELRASLSKFRIGYLHLKKLGGLRHARKDSPNVGWRNAPFRGFADYMQTEEFQEGLDRLKKIAQKQTVAIMCAEAVWWSCHRSLIADALTKQKWQVLHIQSRITATPHRLTPFLRIRRGRIVYLEMAQEVKSKKSKGKNP